MNYQYIDNLDGIVWWSFLNPLNDQLTFIGYVFDWEGIVTHCIVECDGSEYELPATNFTTTLADKIGFSTSVYKMMMGKANVYLL